MLRRDAVKTTEIFVLSYHTMKPSNEQSLAFYSPPGLVKYLYGNPKFYPTSHGLAKDNSELGVLFTSATGRRGEWPQHSRPRSRPIEVTAWTSIGGGGGWWAVRDRIGYRLALGQEKFGLFSPLPFHARGFRLDVGSSGEKWKARALPSIFLIGISLRIK